PGAARVWIRAMLQKRIPVGAGLGGGSSDAARTILALAAATEWRPHGEPNADRSGGPDERRTGRATDDLSAFAARFGSDVPFFLGGPSAVCSGRGEVLRPVARPGPRWVLL